MAIAALQGHDVFIAGAWGAGAFGNPPATIARLYKEVLKEGYEHCFKKVIFCVLEPTAGIGNKGPDNPKYAIFQEDLQAKEIGPPIPLAS